ncbi:hypothetical protein E0485_14545 [Paenibacillus albiflavus]|uniref:Uncharacterized protein n=1 Tax=Paenibacillus albiflavus TaxID=2545760 RepID=A0A4V2WNN0_9BACL|nr:hypothetical protein [Paenibacillus albiflavus]TCZ76062.1 hypothetical protein E0485_14545 [Paenibacillus albiflavus]
MRKARSDKLTHIAPYIMSSERELVQRLSRHVGDFEGNLARGLIEEALNCESAVQFFRVYFIRPYEITPDRIIWMEKRPLDINDYLVQSEPRTRLKIKATKQMTAQLTNFQIALGTLYLAHATYALLRFALTTDHIIPIIAPGFKEKIRTMPRKQIDAWSVIGR